METLRDQPDQEVVVLGLADPKSRLNKMGTHKDQSHRDVVVLGLAEPPVDLTKWGLTNHSDDHREVHVLVDVLHDEEVGVEQPEGGVEKTHVKMTQSFGSISRGSAKPLVFEGPHSGTTGNALRNGVRDGGSRRRVLPSCRWAKPL